MRITLSPVRLDESLTISRTGGALIVNGVHLNFSQLPEGATLPEGTIKSDWFIGPVRRTNGELHLTLRLPHGPKPPQEVAFPEPITVTEDGPILLPGQAEPAVYEGAIAEGEIDWTQMVTAEQAAEAERRDRVPQIVSMRQARLAMLYAGILDDVEAMIGGMEGEEGQAARIDWAHADTVRRDWPLVEPLSAQLNMTSEQVDDLFIYAGSIPQ